MNPRDAYVGVCARAAARQAGLARDLFGAVRSGGDAAAVHDLRVASRRLRAALSLLEAGGVREARAWRKAVRRLTRVLGRARDLDVQIGFLRKFVARRGGVADALRLKERLEARRREVQKDVRRALRRAGDSGVLDEAARMGSAVRVLRPAAARARAAVQVRRLLRALLDLAPFAAREDASDGHHRMRIAAKRLRYALEVFLPVFGRRAEAWVRAIKELQEMLGELHDCDVWIASLAGGGGGLDAVRRDRLRRRKALYARFVSWWSAHGDLWRRLREGTGRPR